MTRVDRCSVNEGAYPLVAYESCTFRGSLCGVTIHYLATPAQLATGEHSSFNLVLTAAMARNLARALLRSADEADAVTDRAHTH